MKRQLRQDENTNVGVYQSPNASKDNFGRMKTQPSVCPNASKDNFGKMKTQNVGVYQSPNNFGKMRTEVYVCMRVLLRPKRRTSEDHHRRGRRKRGMYKSPSAPKTKDKMRTEAQVRLKVRARQTTRGTLAYP